MKKVLIEQTVANVIIILLLIFLLTTTTNIVSFTVILIPIIYESFITIKYAYKKIKYIKSFDKNDMLKIENSIQNPIFESIDYTLTEKFIFNKCNLQIINYSDIYLIKTDWTVSLGRMSDIYDCVYIVSKKGNYCLKSYQSNFINSEKHFKRDLYEFLLSQNKEILNDDTKENKKILKEKYNIDLKGNWKLKAKRTRKLIRFYF